MGAKYRYVCSSCQYEANVSGGPDAGMLCCTQTIVCHDCQRLYDVITVDRQEPGREHPLACPRSHLHSVSPWTHPASCPKCGTLMDQEGLTILWD